jgi:hypothetical protein
MVSVTLEQYYLYAKVIGATGSVVSILYGIFSWLKKTYKQAQTTSDNVSLLMTNHFPHLQATLSKQDDMLNTLSSDIRDVSTKVDGLEVRLEDTKTGVKVLGESFLRHLENTSREPASRNKGRKS